jgi:hypothetical protein
MNTQSIGVPAIGSPGRRPMYRNAASMPRRRSASGSYAGSGTTPSIGSTCSGEVPQVTIGPSPLTSTRRSVSKTASSSDGNSRQARTASSNSSACGAIGRPAKYS